MSVIKKQAEFVRPSIQKVGIEFHLHDLVTLFLGRSLGTGPGNSTMEKVDENVGKGFEIVTA